MNIIFYTLLSQSIFATWFFIIHFIPIPPLNDIDKFPNSPSWKRTLFIHWLVLVMLIIGYSLNFFYLKLLLIAVLSLFMVGHINTWWLPYLFGWPKVFIDSVQIAQMYSEIFACSRQSSGS